MKSAPPSADARLDLQPIFDATPGLLMVLAPDHPRFTILAATDAHLHARKKERSAVVGRALFDVFPDSPDNPASTAARNARASLARVIDQRVPPNGGTTAPHPTIGSGRRRVRGTGEAAGARPAASLRRRSDRPEGAVGGRRRVQLFALSSVLKQRGMEVLTAGSGEEAVEIVAATPAVAVAIVDIMMPGMDGYQTIEAIRREPTLHRLPIVALTAKAMNGDREKCLEAGDSDHLAKSVDAEQLLSALRLWLHR